MRDYLAAHAPPMPDRWGPGAKTDLLWLAANLRAAWAYAYADAMITERTKAAGR